MANARVSTATAVNPGDLAQHAQGVTNVLHRVLDEVDAPRVAAFLLALREAVHGAQGRMARVFGRHALREELLDLSFEVILQFFVEVLLHAVAAEERTETQGNG